MWSATRCINAKGGAAVALPPGLRRTVSALRRHRPRDITPTAGRSSLSSITDNASSYGACIVFLCNFSRRRFASSSSAGDDRDGSTATGSTSRAPAEHGQGAGALKKWHVGWRDADTLGKLLTLAFPTFDPYQVSRTRMLMKTRELPDLLPEREGFPALRDLRAEEHLLTDEVFADVCKQWKIAYDASWEDIRHRHLTKGLDLETRGKSANGTTKKKRSQRTASSRNETSGPGAAGANSHYYEPPELPTGPSDKAVTFALRCLDLKPSCVDKDEMKARWRDALWKLHPDRCADADSERKMQQINAAKDLLEEKFGKF
ncbi:unnamed protein product [Amoebophrya sp. A120]|nr:unnamed protein product [Amoebophrya sp. A120]|eukprot:GSA120T00005064001.1